MTRCGHAYQAFVTRVGIMPGGHCDRGPCDDPEGSCRAKALALPLPGEQLSEEAASLSLTRQQLLRRKQLSWVPLASVHQSITKMSKRQEANAHCQSREGQPLLSKQQQVPQRLPQAAAEVTLVTIMPLHGDRLVPRQDTSRTPTGQITKEASLESGHSLPHSGTVTRTQRLSVSDLPPLHGPPLTVTPPCWFRPEMPKSASARVKLPPLPAAPAASASSPRRRPRSACPVTSRSRELPPVPAQLLTRSVPSSPTDRPTVPQPPAPRRWRSIVRGARRALRRLFSFSCLRGQPEE
ncbi:PREDICTED: uncharacterized protein LOC101821516 [Ficedula albicollis]|uniref:uncharacterized protein LOC101821516 n=1 Tax=Ficedula albicollis TaxID=59894 RepID=UPI00035991A7|nr:PREDICTED: uncharacterized protein LOC101821516 [Ficedula albicollis]